MSATIIDGNATALKIREELKERVAALTAAHGRVSAPRVACAPHR